METVLVSEQDSMLAGLTVAAEGSRDYGEGSKKKQRAAAAHLGFPCLS